MKRAFKLLLSILLTVGFGWWAFRDADWHAQLESLKSAHYWWLVPYFLILVGIHICRTLRWGCYLTGIEKVPLKKVNEASAIGFMMLLILPFRLGEFARPYLIASRSTIRKSAAMTSVVLERIVDGIVIASMLRVLLFFVPSGGTPEMRLVKLGADLMFAIFGGGFAFLLFALWQQKRAVSLIRATAGRIAPGVAHKVAEIVDSFVGAMRQLPSPAQMFGFVFFTAGYWALNGYGMYVLAKAFNLPVNPFQGFVVLTVLVVGLMIPSAPGYMGTFQAWTKLGLALFVPENLVRASGLAYANVMWLCQTVQQVAFGLIFMVTSHTSFSDLAGKLNDESRKDPDDDDSPEKAIASA